MATKRDYEQVKKQIEALASRVKAKTATPEETIELAEARGALRRHKASIRIKNAKEAMKKGKREALIHILDANGISEENQLKSILREARPELIPGKTEKKKERGGETPEHPKEEKSDQYEAAPICEKCGMAAKKKYSALKNKGYWICPHYSNDDKSHYFSWIES